MTKPAAFEYYAPRTLEECLGLLTEHGEDARLLAGGQSLVPLMNLRMATPEVLIDLNGVDGLSYIRDEDGTLVLGAMTRYADVEASPLVARLVPMLIDATAEVGYPAIRTRGTVGGTLAHADPVAEWPCIARALDADLVATGPSGSRTIPAETFFAGMFTTALAPDEVLTEVRFPPRGAPGASAFLELARKTGDYAVVAVAVDLAVAGGVVDKARVAFANLADRPVRPAALEGALAGAPVGEELDPSITDAIGAALEQYSTDEARAERVQLAAVLARRAITHAMASARGGVT